MGPVQTITVGPVQIIIPTGSSPGVGLGENPCNIASFGALFWGCRPVSCPVLPPARPSATHRVRPPSATRAKRSRSSNQSKVAVAGSVRPRYDPSSPGQAPRSIVGVPRDDDSRFTTLSAGGGVSELDFSAGQGCSLAGRDLQTINQLLSTPAPTPVSRDAERALSRLFALQTRRLSSHRDVGGWAVRRFETEHPGRSWRSLTVGVARRATSTARGRRMRAARCQSGRLPGRA